MTTPFAWLGALSVSLAPTGTLSDLVPTVRPHVEALLAQATSWGMQPSIVSVGRSCEQQAEKVKLGYSQADLCRSMHTLGHAIDVNLHPNTCATYSKLGEWWEARGGVWGGRWKQFGPCGDQGHFHWGFDGAGAVPTSVCPSGVTLETCQKIRSEYLEKAFSQTGLSRSGGLGAGALLIAAGVAFVWATMSIGKKGLLANPKKFGEYELHEHAAPARNEWTVEAYFGDWRKAGEAQFAGVYDGDELVGLKGWEVYVKPEHRRKGLASAMYRHAEEVFGLPIMRGDFQTPEGSSFLGGRK